MKKISLLAILTFSISLLFFTSCDTQKTPKPSSTGKLTEIMVVADNSVWESKIGGIFKEYFSRPQQGLPQSEAGYIVINYPQSGWSSLISKHRNIVNISIDKSLPEPKMEIRKDVWARPQIVVKIVLNSKNEFPAFFEKNKKIIATYIREADYRRINRAFAGDEAKSIRANLSKKYNISMVFPKGFFISKKDDNIVWIRKEGKNLSQAIVLYFADYTDTNIFNYDRIIKLRDSILQLYIPGPNVGTFMTTEQLMPVSFEKVRLNDRFAVETRGLWNVEGMFYGGGPFVNYITVDEKRGRFVMIDGYVFAPKFNKKDYLLHIEAIIHTIKFLD